MEKSTVTGKTSPGQLGRLKLKIILPMIFGALAFCSCSKNLETIPESSDIQEDYTISIEEALASLENFMVDKGMVATKGGMSDYIDNHFIVSPQATKASCTDGNVLYAVNFKEEGGYALLAADTRIQEDILAVTDMGSVSESDFDEPILEMVPTDNDDISEDEYNAMTRSGVTAELIDKQFNRECLKYAYGKIGAFGKNDSDSVSYSWKTVREVPRIINTAWTQSTSNNDVFNKYCPEVGLIWKSKAPAGCVCIAVSQIISYHGYPNLTINGIDIDYPEIRKIYSYDNLWNEGSDAGKEMLAQLCFHVGGLCNTIYGSIFGNSFGFALPTSAKSCLDTLGYKNVSLDWDYDESRVLESLDNGCPVFMSAVAGIISGHAWVVDGYMKRDYVSTEGTVSKSQTLVHCNWGWHGNCSGYFTSGIFHTQEAVIYDKPSGNTMDQNYWFAFNTITYDRPQD